MLDLIPRRRTRREGRCSVARTRSRFPVRSQRRLTTWIGDAGQCFTTNSSTAKVLNQSFSPGTSVPSLNRPTVVRVRGEFTHSPSVATADLEYCGAYGFGIVTLDALAAGIASIPGPASDPGWNGWFVWGGFSYDFSHATDAGFRDISARSIIDSKAMRKVGPEEAVVVVTESIGGAFQASIQFRMLVKLS